MSSVMGCHTVCASFELDAWQSLPYSEQSKSMHMKPPRDTSDPQGDIDECTYA